MLFTDLNPAGGIGANCMHLQIGPFEIVVDAGLHPKQCGIDALPAFGKLRGRQLDLIFITHCHLDHLAALPVLLRDHPQTPVIMSEDSFLLYKRLLKNSCTVMEKQMVESGGKVLPLYSFREVHAASRQIVPMRPGVERNYSAFSGGKLTFSLHSSGHIPGAVAVLLEHNKRRILASGDILFEPTAILNGASLPAVELDTLILETTRGATLRPPDTTRASETERLVDAVRTRLAHGGSVLIPVFALGRMQELLAVFNAARKTGRMPRCPVYVSGLGIELLNSFDRIAAVNPALKVNRSVLNDLRAIKMPAGHVPGSGPPSLYLLSSGMLTENTPSYAAAAAMLGSPANAIYFVGYCDPDSPGGNLQSAVANQPILFKALKKKIRRAATVAKFDLSSHADRTELLSFAQASKARCIVLAHGDPAARSWMAVQLSRLMPKCRVMDPVPLAVTEV